MNQSINLAGILLGAIVALIESMVWYSPFLFGAGWKGETGALNADPAIKKTRGRNSIILSFLSYLIIALALNQIIIAVGAFSFISYLWVALACWIGFSALALLIRRLFRSENRIIFSWTDSALYLIMLVSIVLTLFILH
jgi:Protein of unknown function (DUF1761)